MKETDLPVDAACLGLKSGRVLLYNESPTYSQYLRSLIFSICPVVRQLVLLLLLLLDPPRSCHLLWHG